MHFEDHNVFSTTAHVWHKAELLFFAPRQQAVLVWPKEMFIVIPFEGPCYPPVLHLTEVAIRVRVNG